MFIKFLIQLSTVQFILDDRAIESTFFLAQALHLKFLKKISKYELKCIFGDIFHL
jgi:hypothetical protein